MLTATIWLGYWNCNSGTDANRKEATGTIKITDFMHDTGIDDVTFEVTLDTDSKASQTIRDVVRKSLGALIRDALRNFSKDLLECKHLFRCLHLCKASHDCTMVLTMAMQLLANGKLSREEAKTTPKAPLVEKSRATTTVVKTTEVVGEVTSIFHKVMFNTTPQKMYFALLDKKLVSYWSHSDADIGMLPGSNYSLFNGNVTGKIVSLTACKRIEMTWRLKSWLEGHYSDVIMYFDDLGDGKMQLVLSQKNVPVAEKEITEKNWDTFYWAPIKQAYHY
eukprot:jgi/Hompol1/1448/HPOL_001144-RA